eukprot:767561-Hanusia_phi.AAC.7
MKKFELPSSQQVEGKEEGGDKQEGQDGMAMRSVASRSTTPGPRSAGACRWSGDTSQALERTKITSKGLEIATGEERMGEEKGGGEKVFTLYADSRPKVRRELAKKVQAIIWAKKVSSSRVPYDMKMRTRLAKQEDVFTRIASDDVALQRKVTESWEQMCEARRASVAS